MDRTWYLKTSKVCQQLTTWMASSISTENPPIMPEGEWSSQYCIYYMSGILESNVKKSITSLCLQQLSIVWCGTRCKAKNNDVLAYPVSNNTLPKYFPSETLLSLQQITLTIDILRSLHWNTPPQCIFCRAIPTLKLAEFHDHPYLHTPFSHVLNMPVCSKYHLALRTIHVAHLEHITHIFVCMEAKNPRTL